MPFTLGQRWISNAENELGLGTVVAIDARTVTLLFPASGENRLYARSDAPITRVLFSVGDIITSHEGWQLKVGQIDEDQGLYTYRGHRLDADSTDTCLREVMLDNRMTFSKPQDRLFAALIDRMDRFALRYQALQHQSHQFKMPSSGLRGIRASLIPHQLYIAHEVSQRYAPRVLLADEVGLGKTIEAGMIIHQQLLSGRAERVLIAVPESLQYQWIVEMMRRFNLYFSLFDDERYAAACEEEDGNNPFETEQLLLCSLDFVCRKPERLQQLAAANWDLLVVDEAHHLQWSEESPSTQYQAIATLVQKITGILLLTATPEQLGQQSHFARLRLLDPNRFHSYSDFVQEQQLYRPIADTVALLLRDQTLSPQQLNLLSDLIEEQDVEPLLKAANSDNDDRTVARQELIQMLMDRHGTSRVLFRNTRQSVKGFPQRQLHQIKLPMPHQYQTLFKVNQLLHGEQACEQQALSLLYPEQLYQTLEEDNATWWHFDPRVEWLLNYLLAHRQQKIVIICAKAATAIQLEQVLREREAIHAALFHEGLSLMERDRAAAWFATAEEGAQVLLCSEIGSEGRNFQFAHQLIMFDLPFNPDLLEQRIGRLDRIGQTQDIQIIVPYLEGSAQAILLRWYDEALNAFEHTCPTGRAIYDEYYSRLLQHLAHPALQEGWDEFIQQCRARHQHLKNELEQGRDRLLEIHSSGGEVAQNLVQTIAAQDNDIALVSFALSLFDIIGIHQEDRSDNLLVITPSDQMLVLDFPGIPQDDCTITFDREQALSREDAQFLTWEHPIIRNGLDLVVSGTIGSCAVSLLKNKQLPVGTFLLELVYVVEAQAPKNLQLTRFLPPTPVRLLLDGKGNNLAAQVSFEQLDRQLKSINRHNGSKLAKALQTEITALLQQTEQHIAGQAKQLIDAAIAQAQEELSRELSRLEALRAINPTIRDDEVETLTEHRQQVVACLQQASWRLDSLRLIVVTHQ